MDLLCNAYSNSSDEEPEPEPGPQPSPVLRPQFRAEYRTVAVPPSKRPKPDSFQSEAPIPGRYLSKRERGLLAQAQAAPASARLDQNLNLPPPTSPVWGSIADSALPRNILLSLKRARGRAQQGQISERLFTALHSHTKPVNALSWSQSHAHLLASAGMDHTICIWNVWSQEQKIAQTFEFHNAAVKDVKWSRHGLSVLSCGYDCSSRLIDVEKGVETQIFKEDQVVGVIKFHPDNSNLFLSGGSKGRIKLWDIRTGKEVHEYIRDLGPILDVEFTINGKHFISSSDVSGGNVSENSIIVWDVSRQVPLSNQVYVEAYTCPCVRCHPFDPCFVAQSNGNYIAIFSTNPPFKLDKYKRYESHGVSGFPIKCNFSSDGEKLVSGSSDGSIYFYSYRSSDIIKKIKAYEQACIDVAFHPIMPNVIASCGWNGEVSVFE
ncbi:WD repeat-containing protein 25 [Manihot esculenta]|uniref:Uncharacterized protein n=1 Tax=Manihot esculenta TaxID=3983 RepID=A0A2C9UE77_MANES|nr:WD repeat-containing protein 25 [Manihot esculenta]